MSKSSAAPASAASEAVPAVPSQPEAGAPSAPPAPATGREPIRVETLRFRQSVDLPGQNGKTSISWGQKHGAGAYEVHYLPWMRHHRVTYFERNKGPQVRMYPETWADWVPRSE